MDFVCSVLGIGIFWMGGCGHEKGARRGQAYLDLLGELWVNGVEL